MARSRPNAANKDKTTSDLAKNSSGVTREEKNHSVSQDLVCQKDDQQSKRLLLDEQDGQVEPDSVSVGKFGMKCNFSYVNLDEISLTVSPMQLGSFSNGDA